MPQKAWSNKRERQYEHIKESAKKRGTSTIGSRSATQNATWSSVFGFTRARLYARPQSPSTYFFRSTARCSCALFILERPEMFMRFASL